MSKQRERKKRRGKKLNKQKEYTKDLISSWYWTRD